MLKTAAKSPKKENIRQLNLKTLSNATNQNGSFTNKKTKFKKCYKSKTNRFSSENISPPPPLAYLTQILTLCKLDIIG